jgi:heme/copper-type cytochrome/quinol oxidase subunit 2
MSAPRLRPVVTPILGVVAAALCAATALICAGAALADSEPPPPETTSHIGTLVIVGCIVIAVVLTSVIVMRSIARSRRNKQIYEAYVNERETTPTGATQPRKPSDGGGA